MFDALISALSASPWTYVVVLATIAGSAVFPPLPSETMIITAGVLAGTGGLWLPLVILAGALGASLGDNGVYLVGRGIGERATAVLARGERGRASVRWAADALSRGAGPLIVVCRFIPGGRTAVGFAAGTLGYRWPRFAVFSGIGATCWAVYGSLIGYIGGETFQQSLWKALLLAAGLAIVVGGTTEALRRRHAGKDGHRPTKAE